MRVVWTLLKIIVGLAVAIPVGILVLAITMGVVGTLVGIAVALLRLAVIGLIAYGVFRVARFFLAPSPKPKAVRPAELPAPDPYYAAAMRELDAELRN